HGIADLHATARPAGPGAARLGRTTSWPVRTAALVADDAPGAPRGAPGASLHLSVDHRVPRIHADPDHRLAGIHVHEPDARPGGTPPGGGPRQLRPILHRRAGLR